MELIYVVFGIDISKVGIEKMKKEFGIDGLAMDFYDLDKLERKFDFITCNHVLEHTWRDRDLLVLAYRRLNPNGIFLAAVPNNCSGPEETEEHVRKYDKEIKKPKNETGEEKWWKVVNIIGHFYTSLFTRIICYFHGERYKRPVPQITRTHFPASNDIV